MRTVEENYHAVADLAEMKGVRLLFKSESTLMKIIGRLLFWMPYKTFMEGFTTTLGNSIYLADRYTKMPEPSASETATICHELVHVEQFNRLGRVPMSLAYLFPQWLAVLSLGAFLAFTGNLWFLLCLLFLAFAAPIPAPWRMIYEVEAYATGYAAYFWVQGMECPSMDKEQLVKRMEGYVTQFTGWNYYRMWPFKADVEDRLHDKLKKLHNHEWDGLPIVAREVYEATLGADK